MRILLILLLASLSIQIQAQIISTELLEHYTVDEVEIVLGEFGLPVSFLPLNYEVDYYKVNYMTQHPNGSMVEVSGGLAIPTGLTCAVPLSSYQHGTIAAKTDAPSQGSDEGLLGVLYASVGIACALPDYIGLGDSEDFHLYVHADSEARASMDLVLGAHDLQEELGYTLNGQHVIWGYSQGGHATMALQKLWEEEYSDDYDLVASAPMSGPYDLSGVQAEVITSDEFYPTPGYVPYVILSYQAVYGNLYDDIGDLFIEPYASMIPDLFDGINGMGYINNQLPSIPNQMLQPDLLEDFQSNPDNPIRLALEDNDLLDWTPETLTRIYYCEGDDQVNYMNAVIALEAYEDNGSTSVSALNGGDYDHSGCAPLAMLGGFNFFQEVLVPTFDPQVSFETIDVSGLGADDGSITMIADDITGWEIDWNNGETGANIDGLSSGFYVVTITNPDGCSVEFDVSIGITTAIILIDSLELNVYPNPTNDVVSIIFNGSAIQVMLVAPTGQILRKQQLNSGESVDFSGLAPGVYSLLTHDGQQLTRVVKF
jgi:hypothetical protein